MGNLQSYPSSSRKKYDVFINFRGRDTRNCFTSHLYEALRRKEIETFIDNQIEKGDELSPALMTAINESKISVVIFSEDYATAKWCLRELVEILKCKKKNNQIVLPVFYWVYPYHVRHQTKSFEAPFVEHEKNLQKEVQTWRDALAEACDIIGWHSSNGRTDAELVKEIVTDIWEKLMSEYIPPDFGKLIGLEPRIKEIISSLYLHVTTDVRIIGIWGMGGIGKTTLANAIFNQNSNQFERVCFIQNVREKLETRGGLVSVQKEILSKMFKDVDMNLDSLTIPPKIKQMLSRLKVFIVLDDVDDSLQMQNLVECVDGLGQGSRIILTSRNKHILQNCCGNDDNVHKVEGFNYDEAYKLFCKHAFDKNDDSKDLMVPLNKLIHFAKGNPLALRVLGSSLKKKGKQEWETVVNKLEPTNLNSQIFDVLKVSYDGLDYKGKNIFLDIACFLKGKNRDYVAKILDDCYYSLSVLVDRSLITISSYGEIEMHDLLEEMGRDIVHLKSPSELGKRSRLWRPEDVLCTLENDDGTPEVQGIVLDMMKINKDIHLSPQVFKKMYNLRLLKFYNSTYYDYSIDKLDLSDTSDKLRKLYYSTHPTHSKVNFSEVLSNLSEKLRSLIWYEYPLQALPSNYNPNNLVELDLRGSNFERLWERRTEAPKLRWLNLSGCTRVTEIQGLSKSPLLESINLKDCSSLLDFPQLAQHLKNLHYLDRSGCNSLRSFPSDIHFESLTSLDLSNCNNLTKFGSQISGNNITRLDLSGTAIKELHHSIAHLNGLVELVLRRCENLETLPSSIFNLTSLRRLDLSDCSRLEILPEKLGNLKSHSIGHLNRLQELFVLGCENLKTLPSGICNLTSLRHLDLSNCSRLEILPGNLGNLKSLRYLAAKRAAIKELPHSIAHLNGLEELSLVGCENLKTLPSGICNLTSLQYLDVSDCSRLEMLPKNLGNLKSLEYLYANRAAIKELPHSIGHLNGLKELFLVGCENLKTLPSDICKLTYLQYLDLSDCSKLEMLPKNLGNLKSLEYLAVKRAAIKELPYSIGLLNGLEELFLVGCENLETLPSSICNLTFLQHLDLSYCSRLEMLPKNLGNLKSLECLLGDRTAISKLPSSMKHLKNLTKLSCRGCRGLRFIHSSDLPYEFGFARILNTKAKAKAKPTEFIFTDCMDLEETAVGNMLARLVKFLHREYIRFIFCYTGSEVPKWFRYTTEGSSIKFQETSDLIVKGFAVCAVIAFEKYLFNGDSKHKLGIHFHCTYSDGDQSSPTIITLETAYVASRNRTLIDSDHVVFGYCDDSYSHFGTRLKNYSFEFQLSEESPNCRLKSCGVCPIYFQDLDTVGSRFDEEDSDTDDSDEAGTSGSRFDEEDSDTDDSDEAGTSGSRFDEEEMKPHPKENESLQTVKYAEPIEHIGETSGIRRSRTSNDHLEEEVEPHPKRLNI